MHVQCSSKPFSTDRKQPPEHSQKPPRSDSYFDWNVLVAKFMLSIFQDFTAPLASRLEVARYLGRIGHTKDVCPTLIGLACAAKPKTSAGEVLAARDAACT